eukprot:CAMPEP_0178415874 /NCGR_PEP_ID=MMETSP0689_2-20121128/23774_1 /TAXON_ID=160604 /ORGANISM="Amphidinium massartii, Strain CS-259" /LENGTH=64 /DNA_ID=CAMNT_0020037203 /DNA_START=206 /DNA_END=401 /DNA_ORIENTATION=-
MAPPRGELWENHEERTSIFEDEVGVNCSRFENTDGFHVIANVTSSSSCGWFIAPSGKASDATAI